ncbi:unnamed protein product [Linum tenue]|uniref:Uncharacterized protein n=1 Tax=Linum tenue TaxID=586396 RepID=A0AAV0S7M6_9ROSI|nr:unnamed protein product [Linum tenue]
MAAAASGSNGNGNKYFHLNVVAIVTTATGPNGGAPVTREAERVFTLPLEPMLNEDSATPYVRKIVESFLPMKIPDPEDNVAIVDKIADVALRLFVALEREETDNNNNNKTDVAAEAGSGIAGFDAERKWFYSKDGLPQTKVTIYVAHDGFVSAVGDFESEDDEDDTDSDEEDDGEEEEGVEAMEKK